MKNKFAQAVRLAFQREVIKKLVFSRPNDTEALRASARLCIHRERRLLAVEYALPGNTVSHKNVVEGELDTAILGLLSEFSQANLITTAGDVEWRRGKRSEMTRGADGLIESLSQTTHDLERAIEALDNKKNRMLNGDEDFLIKLSISDKSGRVHDKKQGKFRQICRFLEHIDTIYDKLPKDKALKIYDLCCGKSYLSFAVYYYLVTMKKRQVELIGIDLKRDVIRWCAETATALEFSGMKFINDDITNIPDTDGVDMVISLHACDVATDIVINTAAKLGARVILSTPCCHKYLNGKITNKNLSFVTDYPQLSVKFCEALTDAIRLARLKSFGYEVFARELTDPENTPKNTIIIAEKKSFTKEKLDKYQKEYENILKYLLGDSWSEYLSNI